MTSFVESCVGTIVDSAKSAERRSRKRPRATRMLRALEGKRNILITTHTHPDPDAIASAMALAALLRKRLPEARVHLSFKGRVGGGMNEAFVRHVSLSYLPWDDKRLTHFDAFVLLDTQPGGAFSPLPAAFAPSVVVDHHRLKTKKPCCPFVDIRTDVGATCSIVFSYFMELEVPIDRELAAAMLFAIESDLAGAAGTPSELDNIALSNLTLVADTHKLYQMRYVDLPQTYYQAYASALQNAVFNDNAIVSHIGEIDSLEKPAVMADFLLRFDQVQWSLVTGVHEDRLIMSLRCSGQKFTAAKMIRRLVKNLGDGGGHPAKAGGFVLLTNGSDTEVERIRKTLRRRLLRALGIKITRGQKLVS
jgi:nanoRNase/pAp phosphatase (c-di-AMP/oligoRNAs hydrolase)